MSLGRFHAVEVPVLGDVGVIARLLAAAAALPADPSCAVSVPRSASGVIWREEKARRRRDDFGHGVSSPAVVDVMSGEPVNRGSHRHEERLRSLRHGPR